MHQNPQAVYQQAITEYNESHDTTVIKLLKPLVKSKQANSETLNLLGASYHRLGKPKESLKHLKSSLKSNPKFAQTHSLIANIYSNDGRITLSLEHYKKAFKLNKTQPRPLMEIALHYQRKEE